MLDPDCDQVYLQEVRVDVTMRPGTQSQTIIATETIPMVNPTFSELAGNSRSYAKLLKYASERLASVEMKPSIMGFGISRTSGIFGGVDDITDANVRVVVSRKVRKHV